MTDHRLYFQLQRAAHQVRLTADRRFIAVAGVTTAQLGALFVVQDQPGLTQQELAGTLGQRESAITAMVGRLVDAGLISKNPHPRHYRAAALELTAAGVEALHKVRPEVDRCNAELVALIGADEFDITTTALRKLATWESR